MTRTSFLQIATLASIMSGMSGMSGCLGPPQTVDETSEALGFANDKAAFDFFVAKGLTNFQAAGIVGNLDQESGVNPGSVQYGGGPGRGIAQWSVGGRWDTSANDNVLAYAKSKGQSSGSLNLQLEFIWYELTTFGYGFSQLKATTNITDATLVFMDKYEICGTCASSQRISYAKAVLNAYGATPSYGAGFVSQTWPYASMPAFTVKCGQSVAAKIVLKNAGAKTWDSSTRLATTMPRDRTSIFAGSDWLSPGRPAAIKGTVAPNSDGTFSFSFHGPTGTACVPGTYHEFFGVVQEGTAWFSDSGQGGPPDNQLEALIDLQPGDPGSADTDGGTTAGGDDSGSGGVGGGGNGNGDNGGSGGAQPQAPEGAPNGCSVALGGMSEGSRGGLVLILFAFACVLRRRIAG